MSNQENAELLSDLLKKPSVDVMKIIKHLEFDDFDEANKIWLEVNDSLYQDVVLYRAMIRVFGCKLHSNVNCTNWLCVDRRSLRFNPKEVTRKN